eukprot:3492488-Pyramimonas_sp.AAC.1
MGKGIRGVALSRASHGARDADLFRRFLLLIVDARTTLTLGDNFELSWEKLGLRSDKEIAVKDFHMLMRGGKTAFTLPHAQQRRCGDFAQR